MSDAFEAATAARDDAIENPYGDDDDGGRQAPSGIRRTSSSTRRAPPRDERFGTSHNPAVVRQGLAHVVADIIPKILAGHPTPPAGDRDAKTTRQEAPPTSGEVATLAHHAVAADAIACDRWVEEARARGRGELWIMVELIPAVAHHLGVEWENDRCSFADVTVGAGSLQRMLRRVVPGIPEPSESGLVVLSCLPDEQHRLGVFMLGEWLQQRGWRTHVEPGLDDTGLLTLIREEPVVAVGLSVSHDGLLPALSTLFATLREAAPTIGLLVGGAAGLEGAAAMSGAFPCPHAEDAMAYLDRLDKK